MFKWQVDKFVKFLGVFFFLFWEFIILAELKGNQVCRFLLVGLLAFYIWVLKRQGRIKYFDFVGQRGMRFQFNFVFLRESFVKKLEENCLNIVFVFYDVYCWWKIVVGQFYVVLYFLGNGFMEGRLMKKFIFFVIVSCFYGVS